MNDKDVENVFISRNHIYGDLLGLYSSPDMTSKSLHVEFLGEQIDDFGGLTNEMFNIFWQEAMERLFKGDGAMVPHLPIHMVEEKKQFVAIGRVLSHSVMLTRCIPPRLSRTTILQLIYGRDGVCDDVLLNDFIIFLTPREGSILRKALTAFTELSTKERDNLEIIYAMYGMLEQPKQNEIRDQLLAIARAELVDKPSSLIDLMKKGIPEKHGDAFWSTLTVASIEYLFEQQRPTPDRVADVLSPEDGATLTLAEQTVLYYLKQFIIGCDQEELETFLIFTTASVVMPKSIKVLFSKVHGLARRIVAHTCARTIELPVSYNSFQDMKRELKATFADKLNFEMNMI